VFFFENKQNSKRSGWVMSEYDVGVPVDMGFLRVKPSFVVWFDSLMKVWWLVGQEVDHIDMNKK